MATLYETVIHPTAVIEKGAILDEGVSVGAYAYIGIEARLGSGCKIHHHATVEGNTILGRNNEVFPYAFIGGKTHDKKFRGGNPSLRIGDNNVFREYVTVHLATSDGDVTIVGDDNLFLAYSHIAHDCVVGSHVIMSANAALGGHVWVEDHANIGWSVGIHQHCTVGTHCMIGFSSKITQDIPPYMLVDGNPAEVKTYNKVGLERAGFRDEEIDLIKEIYQIMYRKGFNRTQALKVLSNHTRSAHPILRNVIEFADKCRRGMM